MLRNIARRLLIFLGFISLLAIIIAFTRFPFDVHRWLGSNNSSFSYTPDNILMLGGSGMPSESNLIRLYYCAALHKQYPAARIYIAHPSDTSVAKSMVKYLTDNNVTSSNISLMMKGTNTREQAVAFYNGLPLLRHQKNVIVTSPENMFRSVQTFRKAGFKMVGGVPAYENAMFIDLKYDFRKAGGKAYVPDVSGSLDLRYNFWNYLKLEITCIREFFAIAYYKMNGWI